MISLYVLVYKKSCIQLLVGNKQQKQPDMLHKLQIIWILLMKNSDYKKYSWQTVSFSSMGGGGDFLGGY
jgi:hypothetical protein